MNDILERFQTESIKFVLIDVVQFTRDDRSLENLIAIVESMNRIVLDALDNLGLQRIQDVILLPTGDGVYMAIRGKHAPDIHLQLASIIREGIDLFNAGCDDPAERYRLRIAVHEHDDLVIRDINGNENVAGHGINTTARLLKACQPGHIVVGGHVFLNPQIRNAYTGRFGKVPYTDHHGKSHEVYSLIPSNHEGNHPMSAVGRIKGRIGPLLTLEYINQLKEGNWVYHRVYGLGAIERIGPATSNRGRQVTIRFKARLHRVRLTNEKRNYSQWL